MKLIIKDRAMGKTTQLIYTSELTSYPIVVPYEAMIVPTKEIAKKLGCNIPEPVTASDMARGRKRGDYTYDHVLVDEVALNGILKKALSMYLNSSVELCTCSPDYTHEEIIEMSNNGPDKFPRRSFSVSSN